MSYKGPCGTPGLCFTAEQSEERRDKVKQFNKLLDNTRAWLLENGNENEAVIVSKNGIVNIFGETSLYTGYGFIVNLGEDSYGNKMYKITIY